MNVYELPPGIPEVTRRPHLLLHIRLVSPQREAAESSLLFSSEKLLPHPAAATTRNTRWRWTGFSWKNQLHYPAGYQEPSSFLACHESCLVMGLPPPETHSRTRRINRPKYLSRSQMMVVGASGRTPKHTKLPVTTCDIILLSSWYLSCTPHRHGCRLRT